jgi:REP element-mobilizing transposase RayT
MGRSERQEIKDTPTFSSHSPEEKDILDSAGNVLLEPVYPESYDLSYTCLLIPNLPTHKLKDNLAAALPKWLRQICAAHNWQIEFITVNPDYFQWGLRVIPSTQAGQFMQEIRRKTSELILSTFEQIRSENQTDDFWAPGYLVVLGTRPHPKAMVEQYIRLSRRQQGFPTA